MSWALPGLFSRTVNWSPESWCVSFRLSWLQNFMWVSDSKPRRQLVEHLPYLFPSLHLSFTSSSFLRTFFTSSSFLHYCQGIFYFSLGICLPSKTDCYFSLSLIPHNYWPSMVVKTNRVHQTNSHIKHCRMVPAMRAMTGNRAEGPHPSPQEQLRRCGMSSSGIPALLSQGTWGSTFTAHSLYGKEVASARQSWILIFSGHCNRVQCSLQEIMYSGVPGGEEPWEARGLTWGQGAALQCWLSPMVAHYLFLVAVCGGPRRHLWCGMRTLPLRWHRPGAVHWASAQAHVSLELRDAMLGWKKYGWSLGAVSVWKVS